MIDEQNVDKSMAMVYESSRTNCGLEIICIVYNRPHTRSGCITIMISACEGDQIRSSMVSQLGESNDLYEQPVLKRQ